MKRVQVVLAAILGAATACGCASTRASTGSVQPFHVALIPIAEPTRLADPEGAEEDGIELALDTAELAHAVRDAIDGACFARVSLLAPPPGVPPAEFAAWDAERRDAHWIAQSNAVAADLVLECDLAVAPRVVGERNEKFWLNLPLFLLGGPVCYFIGDRTYRGDARLRATLYELHALEGERATFADERSRLVQVESRFHDRALDFLDRADGSPAHFAVSLVVPAGLLARGGEGVERSLSEQVGLELADGLARELALQERAVSAADRVAPFELVDCAVARTPDGGVALSGHVVLECGDIDRMDDFVVACGAESFAGEFDEGEVDRDRSTRRERVLRYAIDARLPAAADAEYVRVSMAAGGRSRILRSFTIPISGGASAPVLAGAD